MQTVSERNAVRAFLSFNGSLQAAIVGVVESERVEAFFDAPGDSRKAVDLRRSPTTGLGDRADRGGFSSNCSNAGQGT